MSIFPLMRRMPDALFTLSVAAAVGVALAAPAVAADSTADELEEVVVVATRLAVSPDKVGNAVTVLNHKVIEESQAVVASDLLATVPGVAVARTGGPGAQTYLRIRGAPPEHTMVLVDGVQLNDPSSVSGPTDFGNMLVGDISRIEVLRGTQSTLYGSQAIGGVVNIVTASPGDKPGGSVAVEAGSMNSLQARAMLEGRGERLSGRLSTTYFRTDGVSTYADGVEKDGYRNGTLSGRLGYDFTDSVSLDLRGVYSDGWADSDGTPPPDFALGDTGDRVKTRQFVGYAGVNFALADGRLQNRVAVQGTDIDRRNAEAGSLPAVFGDSAFKGRNSRYEYQGSWRIADGYSAVFGLQREDSSMRSAVSPPEHASTTMDSIYLQLQAEVLPGLTLTAGDRYDDHKRFGSQTSLQFAAAWALPTDTVLRASWGEGFKAPSLYQLFSDYRNPQLRPEVSHGWDAGVEQHFLDGEAMVSATYFRRRTSNQINFAYCGPTDALCLDPEHSPFGFYENLARTSADGIEAQAAIRLGGRVEVNASYAHVSSIDRHEDSEGFGMQLLRVPRDTASATVTWRASDALSAAVAARYSSSSDDTDFNTFPSRRVAMPAYTLVDLRLSYAIDAQLEVTARMENLFDETYETVYLYGNPGRAGYIGVRYKF